MLLGFAVLSVGSQAASQAVCEGLQSKGWSRRVGGEAPALGPPSPTPSPAACLTYTSVSDELKQVDITLLDWVLCMLEDVACRNWQSLQPVMERW